MKTVLSGLSGAFHYKPAGTVASFSSADVNITTNAISINPYLGFLPRDPVKFSVYSSSGGPATGTLPGGILDGITYYVTEYIKESGILKVSQTENGANIVITTTGSISSPNRFKIEYADYAVVSEVQRWSFQFSRAELDVTKIGQILSKYTAFRSYIPGFADGDGTVVVYLADEEALMSTRIINDVLKKNQVGASLRLYIDKVVVGGVVDETLSRSITLDAILTSADFKANPDDASIISIKFRPAATVAFDFAQTAEIIADVEDYWSNMATQLYTWKQLAYIGWWGN